MKARCDESTLRGMKDVFITGTFKNDWNRQFNEALASFLSNQGFSYYLPQQHTDQSGNRKKTFEENMAGIRSCKSLVAIGAKTQTANWGLEIGYAFSLNKPVIILTDSEHPVALMPEGAASEIVISNLENLSDFGPNLVSILSRVIG